MTRDSATEREKKARNDAATLWYIRIELADDPVGADQMEAFESWKAEHPDNAKEFELVKDAQRPFDNLLFRFLVKDRLKASLAAKSDPKD
ncbi:DUF4880 domain-containing protein [Sphingopyxis sp.]|uniref:DUF4880 domain-containing protein n=1 Tax=Sphingopyxis sp. TaxID=1908224 RepID=UPI00262A0982|nr:DUF4880 domain-containing protein [Sphingopyxis sp.]MCW0199903.1 DUF4880 domain-containing protein [Sphingopyxis sp.]